MLLAGNAAHADISMDAPGSGMMGWILIMMGQQAGFPVPTGGAGMLTAAMARRFEAAGGTVRLGCRATEVVVRDGRAVGVRTEHGDVVGTTQAVVADVAAPAPRRPGRLAPPPGPSAPPDAQFERDPGTVKVDWALDRPVPWRHQPDKTPGTLHLGESVDEVALAARRSPRAPYPGGPSSWSARWPPPTPPGPPRARVRVGLQPSRSRSAPTPGGAGIHGVGPRRRRADGRPDAGPDRGVRPRLRRPGARAQAARAPGDAGA